MDKKQLKERCDIPVFHDDQHGTAIVVGAALLNAVKVTGKKMGELRVVINGAGAAGVAIGKQLIAMGFGNIIMCDINGIICEGDENLNSGQEEISHISNLNKEHGKLADALKGADIFVGVSRPHLVTKEMVATMNNGIVFAMANPVRRSCRMRQRQAAQQWLVPDVLTIRTRSTMCWYSRDSLRVSLLCGQKTSPST